MLNEQQLLKKTSEHFPEYAEASLEPIYEGGSSRNFFRVRTPQKNSLILIRYDIEKEENCYYAEHALFLKNQSLHVPEVLAHLPEEQLLWLQDLGEKNLWSYREEPWEIRRPLYQSALIDAARLHRISFAATGEAGLTLQPEFDEGVYRWEQEYFFYHTLGTLAGIEENQRKQVAASKPLQDLARQLPLLPRQLIHRDLQSQNIIIKANQAWLIDFQGMRAGLAPYDLASLLCDPYVSITTQQREELLQFYYDEMKQHSFSFPFDVEKVFWQCAVQRLMQALGCYAFLSLHCGKEKFHQYIAPGLVRLREALQHLPDRVEALEELLEKIPLLNSVPIT